MEIPHELVGKATVPLWPDAGRLLGIGRHQAYEAGRRGDIPTLRLGTRWLVPVPKLLDLLGYDAADARGGSAAAGPSPAA